MKRAFLLGLLAVFMWLPQAKAAGMEQSGDSPLRTMLDDVEKYVHVPAGDVSWKTFGKTKQITIQGTTKDGYDFMYFKPVFTPEMKALNGKTITVKGFMFPLDASNAQKNFLLGPFPLSCPFHYHVAPPLVLEVHANKHPVVFSYDPVTVTGTLQLVAKDKLNSTFYRLLDARLVKNAKK